VASCHFRDVRHDKRLRQSLERFSHRIGATTPWASQDWANTKAAYRFFANDRISEANILAGHFASTRERCTTGAGFPILVLHGTTAFSYRHEEMAPIGIVVKTRTDKGKLRRPRYHTNCGILMHSRLAVTATGQPLGLAAIKFWNRDKFHGANRLKRRINPTRVPSEKKESVRWLENLRPSTVLLNNPRRCVHIGDRESDIYELCCRGAGTGHAFSGAHLRGPARRRWRTHRGHGDETASGSGPASCRSTQQAWTRLHRGAGNSLLSPNRLSADREAEAVPKTDPYCCSCAGEGETERQGKDRLETSDRFIRALMQGCCPKAGLVGAALENRNLPQNPEGRLQSGGGEIANRGAARKPHCHLERPELENFLDHHAQPYSSPCLAG